MIITVILTTVVGCLKLLCIINTTAMHDTAEKSEKPL